MKRAFPLFYSAILLVLVSCVATGNKANESRLMIVLQAELKEQQGDEGLIQVQKTLQARMKEMKIINVEITIQPPDKVIVLAPTDTDPKRLKDALLRLGLMEFRMIEDDRFLGASEKEIRDRFPSIREGYKFYPGTGSPPTKVYLLKEKADLDGWSVKKARAERDFNGRPCIYFAFNEEGANRFAELTGNNIDRKIAIMLDGKVFSAPIIKTKITSGGQLIGDFTEQEARDLAAILKAGPLPLPLLIVEEKTVHPLAK